MGQYHSPICILGLYSLGGRKSWRLEKKILQTMCSWRILFSGRCRFGDVWGALNSVRPATTSRVACKDAPQWGQSVWPTSEPNGGLLELSGTQTSRSDISTSNLSIARAQVHRWKPTTATQNFSNVGSSFVHVSKYPTQATHGSWDITAPSQGSSYPLRRLIWQLVCRTAGFLNRG